MILQRQQKLMQWNLGAVAAQHIIHLFVGDELLMEVSGGKSAHDDGDVGVDFLHQLGHL